MARFAVRVREAATPYSDPLLQAIHWANVKQAQPPSDQRRACPSCGSRGALPIPGYQAARLARCDACGLVFAGELPSEDDLVEHYAEYPAAGEVPSLTVRRYVELLTRLNRFRRTTRLLDVGCGDGHFLLVAKEQGWRVFGSEYGTGPLARCRELGLDVRPAPFAARDDELGSFDVVTAIEVLEHVTAPREEAERVHSLLRRGGALYLTTPNFNALTRRLLRSRWRVIEYPEHLNLFTPQTLHRLLSSVGFRRLSLTTTGISPSDIQAGLRSARTKSDSCAESGPARDMDQALRSRMNSSATMDSRGDRRVRIRRCQHRPRSQSSCPAGTP